MYDFFCFCIIVFNLSYFPKVHIDVTNHYESYLNLSKFIYDQEISRLRQASQNKVSHSISPVSINAFYVPTENTIGKIYKKYKNFKPLIWKLL